jgi:hypothetical protein
MLDFVGLRHSERFGDRPRRAWRRAAPQDRQLEPWIGLRANGAFNAFLPADVRRHLVARLQQPQLRIRRFQLIRFAQ